MDQDTQLSSDHRAALSAMIEALRISQSATDLMDERFAGLAGLNRTDARCLDIIQRLGRITAGDLAVQSGLTSGAVTAMIDRMERAGYLRRTRSDTDRRKVHVELTQTAQDLAALVYGPMVALGESGLGQMSLAEMSLVTRFLRCNAALQHRLAQMLCEATMSEASDAPLALAQTFANTLQNQATAIRTELAEIWNSQPPTLASLPG